MAVVFFEGFNFSNGDVNKLNSAYWTPSDSARVFFSDQARTGTAVGLTSRANAAPLTDNATLTLSNFGNPFSGNACVGFGICLSGGYGLRSSPTATSAGLENLLAFQTNNGTLSVDVIPTTYAGAASLGLQLSENGVPVTVYDLNSVLGRSWSYTNGLSGERALTQAPYFDFFISAAGGFAVRISAGTTSVAPILNTAGQKITPITSVSSLSAITLFGSHSGMVSMVSNQGAAVHRVFDDLYLTNGASEAEVFLGPNTRIYRVGVNNPVTTEWAQSAEGYNPDYYLATADGDGFHLRSATTGQVALLGLGDLPSGEPSNVAGVKVFNSVRKAGLATLALQNIMAATSSDTPQEVGPTYTIDSEAYNLKENVFLTNPLTSAAWTKAEINSLQLGIKNKS